MQKPFWIIQFIEQNKTKDMVKNDSLDRNDTKENSVIYRQKHNLNFEIIFKYIKGNENSYVKQFR